MKFRQYVDFPGSKDADYVQFSKETFQLGPISNDPYSGRGDTLEILDGETGNGLQRIFRPQFTFDFREETLRVSGFVWGKKSSMYEDVSYAFYSVEKVAELRHETKFVKAKLVGAVYKKEKKL